MGARTCRRSQLPATTARIPVVRLSASGPWCSGLVAGPCCCTLRGVRTTLRYALLPLALGVTLLACSPPQPPAAPPPPPPPPVAAAPVPVAAAPVFAEADSAAVFTDPDRRRKLAAAFAAIDALVDAEVHDKGVTGLSVGVVIDGELVHSRGAGVVDRETKAQPDADTVFRIGSITKSFTGLAVLSLRDEGALALDEPLTRLVPEAAGLVYPSRDAAPITLRQILTHTSGLPRLGDFTYTRSDREPSEEEVVRSLSGFALNSAPGTAPAYSNLGFALLGIAAGRAAHLPLRAALAKRVFEPLGMTSTAFDPPTVPPGRLAVGYDKDAAGAVSVAPRWRLGASEAAGGIYSTVRDMARYVAFQLAAYPARSAPEAGPVRRSSVRESHLTGFKHARLGVQLRDEVAKGESLVDASAASYGFGWLNEDNCDFDGLVWHNGGVAGFTAAVGFLPKRGVGVVALTNFAASEFDAEPIVEKVLLALKKTGGLAARVPPVVLPAAFAPAMTRFLAVYNAWDEAAYKAMLSAERPPTLPEKERLELAGYRALHGACSGYAPADLLTPQVARVAMHCERGALEMLVQLDAKGLIAGFGGVSRDVPAPPAIARAGARLAGLVGKWDERVYRRILGADAAKSHAERVAFFEKVRAAHGACTVASYAHGLQSHELTLACDRGGEVLLELEIGDKDEEAVKTFSMTPRGAGTTCPVKG
jgi:CubicO group peptidase (beta-lactamase class C family)